MVHDGARRKSRGFGSVTRLPRGCLEPLISLRNGSPTAVCNAVEMRGASGAESTAGSGTGRTLVETEASFQAAALGSIVVCAARLGAKAVVSAPLVMAEAEASAQVRAFCTPYISHTQKLPYLHRYNK